MPYIGRLIKAQLTSKLSNYMKCIFRSTGIKLILYHIEIYIPTLSVVKVLNYIDKVIGLAQFFPFCTDRFISNRKIDYL